VLVVHIVLYYRAKFRHRSSPPLPAIVDFSNTMSTTLPILTTANYSLWEPAMEDFLRSKGYWYWIHSATPPDPKLNTKCLLARDSAVGEIRRHLSPELRGIAC